MKLYSCSDCTHTEDTCENCARYQMYFKTNFNKYNPLWTYQDIQTITNIPLACRNCSNHPSNGGSGICHCILGTPIFY